jgi:PAS domain S-box-containing protein
MPPSLKEIQHVFAELPVPAYVWNIATQKFIVANARMLALTGYSETELYRLDWRELVVPGEISRAQKAISAGVTLEGVRWYWRTKEGRIFTVVLSGRQTHLPGPQGESQLVRITLVTGLGANVGTSSDTEF